MDIIFFLMGKDMVNSMVRFTRLEKYDGKYYKQKHIRMKGKKQSILIPISDFEDLIINDILKRPVTLLIIILFMILQLYCYSRLQFGM